MVRVFIKGGVWKNSEDEILKAAVMKYGKQQWARVASLLNRKSAKQCKARWNEWLDPSVRKVEWSRAEDEKLLHLAKLLPAQWKTIGPLIGRTATQCQERYERLLDEAAAAAGGEGGEEGEGGDQKMGAVGSATAVAASASSGASSTGPSAARRLRPGEIDPHPETRPARPDPIDMDEDEIEMLQEARARLANTQGKKAKRKAREKMLAEAKRLADLQKRRELKQAGLLSSQAKTRARKRNRDIDLGVEIPFHKPAPAGFHDTSEEKYQSELARSKRLKDISFKKINEDQYRQRDKEALDAQKKEEARLRALERANMQLAVAEVSKKNDPLAVQSRGRLVMPAPTVTDTELATVAKLSGSMKERAGGGGGGLGSLMPPPRGGGAGGVTDALLGDYTDRPLPTPMRTPGGGGGVGSAAGSSESVRREAENLRMIERGQTPLLGGENPELNEGGTGTGTLLRAGKDDGAMSAVTGVSSKAGSGNANAPTPRIVSGGPLLPSSTPLLRSAANQTPMSMVRDELGLNIGATKKSSGGVSGEEEASVMGGNASTFGDASTFAETATYTGRSVREMAREQRRAAKRARRELELALASLPAPQFEYELELPSVTEDEEEDGRRGPPREKDAAEVEREELERLQREAAKLYEAQSSVLKREGELPRPKVVPPSCSAAGMMFGGEEVGIGERLVMEEMTTLIAHDAHAHPIVDDAAAADVGAAGDKKSKKKKKKKNKRKAEEATTPTATGDLPPAQPLEYLPEDVLDAAKALLAEETDALLREKRDAALATVSDIERANYDVDPDAILAAANTAAAGTSVVEYSTTGRGGGGIVTYEREFETINAAATSLRKQCDKLESKLSIRNGGYMKRAKTLSDGILQSHGELRHAEIEQHVYERLDRAERRGLERRMEALRDEVDALKEAEGAAQKTYGDLLHERHRLQKRLQQP